eukprot:SAG31_NODE_10844_length_1091_cov_1.854839_1_plen_176_part_10
MLRVTLLGVLAGTALSDYAATGLDDAQAVRTRKPVWSLDQLPWLRALSQNGAVASELQALADADEDAGTVFRPNYDPTGISTDISRNSAGEISSDWQGLPLMNRGQLLPQGCSLAPVTCAALQAYANPYLIPRPPDATEVGVRVLKLLPGSKLRPHHGPGGRLVAHLGVRIPVGAT